jgi:hypothetical protein
LTETSSTSSHIRFAASLTSLFPSSSHHKFPSALCVVIRIVLALKPFSSIHSICSFGMVNP